MIKEKLQSAWAWTKRQWKKIVTVFTVGVVLAAGIPAVLSNNSFENLPNVAKEAGLYRIKVDKYTEIEIPETTKPEATLRKWGDETFIRVWYDDIEASNSKQENGKLKWQGNTKEVHLYEIEDGFEFEVILKEKPESNIIELGIESKGLKFYYQPELTQKEIDEGAERPENVIGSYAVYHESKKGDYSKMAGKNYRAGKAFHIYRPQMEDANGWKVWGELFIDAEKEIHNVTIPEDFWQNAQYPVRHASGEVFGTDGEGASVGGLFDDIVGTVFQSGANGGNINSITIYSDEYNNGYGAQGCAIYEESDDSLVGYTENWNITEGWSDWKTLDISIGGTIIGSTDYWLVVHTDNWIRIRYDSDAGVVSNIQSNPDKWPDPVVWENSWTQRKNAIYATYTPSAAEEDEPPPNNSQLIGYNK